MPGPFEDDEVNTSTISTVLNGNLNLFYINFVTPLCQICMISSTVSRVDLGRFITIYGVKTTILLKTYQF
jgi:NADH:ubiquinone oxidoreductase subunit B-like Fe-S oxidoreductase